MLLNTLTTKQGLSEVVYIFLISFQIGLHVIVTTLLLNGFVIRGNASLYFLRSLECGGLDGH